MKSNERKTGRLTLDKGKKTLEYYRPYQTTFQKTKIFIEVKEVLERNSP